MILHDVTRGEGGTPLVLLHGLFGRAANFGAVSQRLAASRRVIALDLRNHGHSPHADAMDYPTMAADVIEMLAALDALPCVLAGHSMGGKVAMALALTQAHAVASLLVADIAPVAYPSHFSGFVAAMLALPLLPGLTRAGADAALAEAVPDAATRAFLLQNLRVGDAPTWTNNLPAIAAALPTIEGWPPIAGQYAGPTLFVSGERSNYVLPDHRPTILAHFPAARFDVMPNVGHWLHAQDPNGFVARVDAFASGVIA